MDETLDKNIIAKIRQGEINEFEKIVKKYSQKIRNFIRKHLSSEMDTDDLTQTIFIKFYAALTDGKFNEEKKISPYLFQIAINELKMHYRSSKKNISLGDMQGEEKELSTNFVFEEDEETLLAFLSKKEKKIAKLLVEGYSYSDIAENLGKPINTVKTWIRRLKLKLVPAKTGIQNR